MSKRYNFRETPDDVVRTSTSRKRKSDGQIVQPQTSPGRRVSFQLPAILSCSPGTSSESVGAAGICSPSPGTSLSASDACPVEDMNTTPRNVELPLTIDQQPGNLQQATGIHLSPTKMVLGNPQETAGINLSSSGRLELGSTSTELMDVDDSTSVDTPCSSKSGRG